MPATIYSHDDVSAEQPPPPKVEQPRRNVKRSLLIGGSIVVGLAAVLLMLAAIGAMFLGVASDSGDFPDRVAVAPVEGAPPADLVLPAEARMESGSSTLLESHIGAAVGEDMVIVADSVLLVSVVQTEIGEIEIYRWAEASENSPLVAQQFCTGTFSKANGSASCGGGTATDVSLSNSETTGGTESLYSVFVEQLPADAAWIVVDTQGGYTIASAVIDGGGYTEWVAARPLNRHPIKVRALDSSFTQIWSAPISR